jgi:hypothetical protein
LTEVEVDLGPTSTTTIDLVAPTILGIKEMGVQVTSPVRCISLSEQVAQKLHACTAPNTSSNRARDLLDILLIETFGQLNCSAALVAAKRVFHERGTHDFPPEFFVPALWRPELEALATQLSFPVSSAAELERMFRETVARIATSP